MLYIKDFIIKWSNKTKIEKKTTAKSKINHGMRILDYEENMKKTGLPHLVHKEEDRIQSFEVV